MSLTDHFSTLFPIYFFKNVIQNWILAATATVVSTVVGNTRKSLCVLFVASIHSWNYGVTYIQLTYFILSNIVLELNLFLWFDCLVFSIYIKSLYEAYWKFLYIISLFLFHKSDSKPTICCHWKWYSSSCKWKQSIIMCFVPCFDSLLQLWCYIYSIILLYFVNHFIEHNIYCFCCYHSK